MRVSKFLLFAFVIALALPIAANAAGPMKAGKWRITMATEMPGAPVTIPPVTIEQCISKEEAENPMPPKTDENSDCKITDYKLDGNVVTWSIECKKEGMTGTGKIIFSQDAYDGVTNLKMGDTDMTQKFTGKFLGACDAK